MPGSMPRNRYMVVIVFLTFFVMSLLTNILGPIVPDIISSFHVGLAAAAFLPFSFFIAYGVMSIPAGLEIILFTRGLLGTCTQSREDRVGGETHSIAR